MPNPGPTPTGTIGFCGSVTIGINVPVSVTAEIDFSATANIGITLVNTWQASDLTNYGLIPVPVPGHTPGNALVVFAAWNGASVNPVSNVADDGHSWWSDLGTSSAAGDCRCAIWIAPNAGACTNVSVGLSWYVQGVTVIVAEFAGLPAWAQLDGAAVTAFNDTSTSFTLTGNEAAEADFVLACIADSDNAVAPVRTTTGWSLVGTTSVNDSNGVGGPADTGLTAVWATAAEGTMPAVTWTTGTATPVSGVLVMLSLSPQPPVQKNANWPAVHVEMALGYAPGNPTVTPTWTDLTPRLIGNSGDTTITSSRGRQYESEAPEAGDLTIALSNEDGALTPGNTESPYYPDVQLGTPVRVWAAWDDRIYAVAAGYTERLPQTWPDPQWGQVPWEAPDALDALSNSVLPSALAGDILTDAPYGYWPFSDTYLQFEAGGLPLSNLARTNLRPFTCQNGVQIRPDGNLEISYLQTGQQWQLLQSGQVSDFIGLPGDPDSQAIAALGFTGSAATTFCPGAFYAAPDLPQPSAGLTVEFWAIIPGLQSMSHFQELLRISGPACNYYIGPGGGAANAYARGVRFMARVNPGPAMTEGVDWLYVDVSDFEGNDFSTGVQGRIADNTPHHFAFVITESIGGNYKIATYLDGVLKSTVFSTGVNVEDDWNYIGAGAVMHNDGGFAYGYNYTMGHLALYPVPLDPSRIASHYNTGITGSAGDDSVTRIAKLLTWGGFGLFRACAPPSPSPVLGPADQISGQSVTDAAAQVATTDDGTLFCDAAGNLTWWPRTFLFDRPVKWVFGDDPGLGEIPYEPGEAYDYDNTFIYNQVTSQRQLNSSGNGALAVVASLSSEQQYFIRSSLAETIETTSDEDAYDQANWLLAKYQQPALRVQQVVIDPASNPSAWPAALGIEQGDVVQLTRRPVGGAVISQTCIVQMVSHQFGPDNWQVTLNMIPYDIESAVLACDTAGYNVAGNNGVGW